MILTSTGQHLAQHETEYAQHASDAGTAAKQVYRRPAASSSAAPSEHSATSDVLVDSLQRRPPGNEVQPT